MRADMTAWATRWRISLWLCCRSSSKAVQKALPSMSHRARSPSTTSCDRRKAASRRPPLTMYMYSHTSCRRGSVANTKASTTAATKRKVSALQKLQPLFTWELFLLIVILVREYITHKFNVNICSLSITKRTSRPWHLHLINITGQKLSPVGYTFTYLIL